MKSLFLRSDHAATVAKAQNYSWGLSDIQERCTDPRGRIGKAALRLYHTCAQHILRKALLFGDTLPSRRSFTSKRAKTIGERAGWEARTSTQRSVAGRFAAALVPPPCGRITRSLSRLLGAPPIPCKSIVPARTHDISG